MTKPVNLRTMPVERNENLCVRIFLSLALIFRQIQMSPKLKTGFLYSDPSFLSGLSRTLDLYGLYDAYNMSDSGAEADGRAIASDWIIVGQDLWDAIDRTERQKEEAA